MLCRFGGKRWSHDRLAWDLAASRYWFVEGNGTYTTPDVTILHSVNVGSLDHCTNNGGSWSPPEAVRECASDNFYVKTIGSMNDVKMLD